MTATPIDCGDPLHGDLSTRRDFLRVGVIGGLGLTLGQYFEILHAAPSDSAEPKADAAIFIYLAGGMSHIDTFDPKPNAPIEYRGELGSVDTKIDGVRFGGLLKQTAKVADKIAVIRSMSHGEAAHERGIHNMLTGYRPSPAIVYPSMGSVVSHELGPRNNLPPYVCVPAAGNPYMGPGYLNSSYGPFSVGGNPSNKNFRVRDLNLPEGVDADRMERRRSLLDEVNAHFSAAEKSGSLEAMDTFYERAYALISSEPAREAFNIKAEPDAVRDEYGRTGIGQSLLLARRLVEAGVRFVTVTYGGWDHHKRIKNGISNRMPPLDTGYATLIRDLDRRGLLERTLVVLTTEFGRTAKLNKDGGRDHWPKVFSIALAGGGLRGGQVVGATNPLGQEATERPVGPSDVSATIFRQLGIDPSHRLISPANRPIDIARHYELIEEII